MANDNAESIRLHNVNSSVMDGRVRGLIELTRAFGDRLFNKTHEIISEPSVTEFTVERGNVSAVLILASDGVCIDVVTLTYIPLVMECDGRPANV